MVNALESNPEFFKDPLTGKTLGKCLIEKLIGEGQTAIVYRARYEPLQKTVAVKVLQPHMTKIPAVLRVFQNEARAVAAVDHENILKIYDVSEDRGHHFLVLELLRGQDLQKLLEAEGPLPVEKALDYVRQAAAGLAAAHRKNIVHRDIKPHNLVVEPDGTVKIVDFGLAAEAEGAYSGGRLGTPHYMSPEQCKGELAKPQSDVYALGITLFHLLTGHPPFAGLQTKEEIIAAHLKGRRIEVEKARAGVPRPVGDLIRKMTRMDPNVRPGAAEVVTLIGEIASGAKSEGARGIRAGRRGRSASSSSSTAVLGGIGAVVLVVLLFLALRGSKTPEKTGSTNPAPVLPNPAATAASKDPVAKPPPLKTEPTNEERARGIFDEAKEAEKGDDLERAQGLYSRVVQLLEPSHELYQRAKAASDELLKVLAERKKGRRKPYITLSDSEKAGAEFEEQRAKFDSMAGQLRVAEVKGELERLHGRTRPFTPERDAIEAAMERLGLVEKLLGMAQGRAHSLSDGKEKWVRYDLGSEGDLIVMSADDKGVNLKSTLTGVESQRRWSDISPRTLLPFLDALRSPKSAKETLWLAYFCRLNGLEDAGTYFDLVTVLDDSPEMRKLAAELRQ
jgi:serine/threonine protein kinase